MERIELDDTILGNCAGRSSYVVATRLPSEPIGRFQRSRRERPIDWSDFRFCLEAAVCARP